MKAPCIVFFTSLLLSLIAFQFQPVLARDSALYVHLAELYHQQGFDGIRGQFDWPWMTILISWIHATTKLPMTESGNLLMALFFAGACTMLTRTTELLRPEAVYWGALVALTLPAFNSYRDVILREPGFWFFSSVAMFWMVRWVQERRPRHILGACVAISLAAIFRLEAVSLIAAILATMLWVQRAQILSRWRLSLGMIVAGGIALIACLFWLISSPELLGHRALYYLELLDPESILKTFNATTQAFATAALSEYSHEHAGMILFWGFFMTLVFSSVLMLGPFMTVILVRLWAPLRSFFNAEATFLIAGIVVHFVVLMIFFIQQGFMTPRYTSFLHLLAVPLVGVLAFELAKRSTKAALFLAGLAILAGIDNVVSLSEKRTHYLDAAAWVQTNIPNDADVYFDDRRIGFYAGRGYMETPTPYGELSPAVARAHDYLVIEQPSSSKNVVAILNAGGKRVLAVFDNGHSQHITIIGPESNQSFQKQDTR